MSRATAMSMLTLFCLLSTLAAGMMEIQRESKAYTMEAYIQKFGHPEENGMGHRIVMLNGRQCVLVESDDMTVRIDGIVDGAPAAAADRLRVCTADRAPAAAADHPVDWASAAAANPPGHEGGGHEGGNAQDLQQCTGQDNNAQPKAKPPQAEPPFFFGLLRFWNYYYYYYYYYSFANFLFFSFLSFLFLSFLFLSLALSL